MPQTCSAAGCKSRKDKDCRKSFFRIPIDTHQRERWLAAINRKDWTPTRYSRICSDHFMLGQPSKDPNHPDYVPSIFPESKKNNSCRSKTPHKSTPTVPATGNTFSQLNKRHTLHTKPSLLSVVNATSEQTNERYPSEFDAALALLHMRKRPRVLKEDCRVAEERRECDNVHHTCSSCHLALLQAENHLLREEVDRLQVQRTELERQKTNLEMENVSLGAQNMQLLSENKLLKRNLQESEDKVKKTQQ